MIVRSDNNEKTLNESRKIRTRKERMNCINEKKKSHHTRDAERRFNDDGVCNGIKFRLLKCLKKSTLSTGGSCVKAQRSRKHSGEVLVTVACLIR